MRTQSQPHALFACAPSLNPVQYSRGVVRLGGKRCWTGHLEHVGSLPEQVLRGEGSGIIGGMALALTNCTMVHHAQVAWFANAAAHPGP